MVLLMLYCVLFLARSTTSGSSIYLICLVSSSPAVVSCHGGRGSCTAAATISIPYTMDHTAAGPNMDEHVILLATERGSSCSSCCTPAPLLQPGTTDSAGSASQGGRSSLWRYAPEEPLRDPTRTIFAASCVHFVQPFSLPNQPLAVSTNLHVKGPILLL